MSERNPAEREDPLRDLILAHLDERMSDEDFVELERRLSADPAARCLFVDLARLDANLREDGLGAVVVPAANSDRAPASFGENAVGLRGVWLAAAAVMIAVTGTWMVMSFFDFGEEYGASESGAGAEQTRGVAVISAEAKAVWESEIDGQKLGEGVSVVPGRLILKEGLAQIDFFGGASISLSGPAEIELVGPDEAILHRGRLRADVPPAARGFEIRAGEILIQDLGTSFGLSLGEDETGDVVVYDGEIRATGTDGKPIALFGGEAARLSGGETMPQSLVSAGEFPDIEEVFAGAGTRDVRRYSAWREASEDLRRDPRLVAYYDFENLTPTSRRLRNRAMQGSAKELDGGIVGARVAEGRWKGKTALDFRLEGDRVRMQIPGEFEAITLMAWVRIDALDRRLNSLFLTDYFDPNEIHWQLSDKGALHFAVSPRGVEDLPQHNRRFYSELFWNPEKSGKWFFFATTARSGEGGGVVHYINGEAVGFSGGTNQEKLLPVMRIGKADLGNWSDPIWPDAAIRTLNGRIDEFAIFSETLSSKEIEEFYEMGRP